MRESKWICERCENEYDLEEGEGWIILEEDEETHWMGRMECLRLRTMFKLIDLPEEEYRTFRAYNEAVEILRVFSGY